MSEGIRPSRLDQCAGCGRDVQRTKTSAEVIYCLECRRAGKAPTNARHGTTRRYRSGCRCDPCRTANNERARKHQAAARARGYVRPSRRGAPPVSCVYCGEPLAHRGPGAQVHKACRSSWKSAEAKRRVAEAKLAKAAVGAPANPKYMFLVGTCDYCQEPFTRRASVASPYCSGKCRRADKPDPVRPSIRRQVLERDGYICQLCSEPTEPDADPLSDWYPTVDHIVPRSKGGTHDAKNLRCAHRWCNSVRGDETYYVEADLRLIA